MWRGGDHWYDVHLARAAHWDDAPYSSKTSGSVFTNINTKQHGVEVRSTGILRTRSCC